MSESPDVNSGDVRVETATLIDLTPKSSPFAELGRIGALARRGWSRGTRPWLGVVMASATALVSVLLHFHVFTPEL